MEQMVSFISEENTLRGILHLPDNGQADHPAIILCHGFMGNKIGLHRVLVKAARFFCAKGYAVLRFDFSGCGDSDGDHRDITIDRQVREVQAAFRFLRGQTQISIARVFLLGLSMGGAVAALASRNIPGLSGLVLWAPVADLYRDIMGVVGNRIFSEAVASGVADYMGFPLGRQFVESLRHNYPVSDAAGFHGPVLVVHGTGDLDISCQNAKLYQEARNNKGLSTEVHLIRDADHTFSSLEWEDKAFYNTAAWMDQNTH